MARLGHGSARKGYTLIEMLVATTLTLVMMGAVATVFGMIGEGVSAARATLEMSDAMRATAQRLRTDLEGVTVTMTPPRRPENNEGYFEYTEGPINTYNPGLGFVIPPGWVARNLDRPRTPSASDVDQVPYEQDSTVADMDDILMFTTRSRGEPFVGRYGGTASESQDAEVAWFIRGRTLYRRVLLVRPDLSVAGATGFFQNNDISVRNEGGTLYANSLGDLTRPENRFAHQNSLAAPYPYHPHRIAGWADTGNPTNALARLSLPLLQECSDATWVAGGALVTVALNPNVRTVSNTSAPLPFDAWANPHPWEPSSGTTPVVDKATGVLTNAAGDPVGTRFGEDVVLSNVIGFDVKAWDPNAPVFLAVSDNGTPSDLTDDAVMVPNVMVLPGDRGYALALAHLADFPPVAYGAYVDLGYGGATWFGGVNGDATGNGPRSGLQRVYDTWSLHYEHDGVKQVGNVSGLVTDAGTNGFDDDGNGLVDDVYEQETQAPYPVPLRGIQVKLRVFEPDSRQIREMTVVHSFLPE